MQSQAAHCWLTEQPCSNREAECTVCRTAYSFLRQALLLIGDTAPKASRLPATAVSPTKRSALPPARPAQLYCEYTVRCATPKPQRLPFGPTAAYNSAIAKRVCQWYWLIAPEDPWYSTAYSGQAVHLCARVVPYRVVLP